MKRLMIILAALLGVATTQSPATAAQFTLSNYAPPGAYAEVIMTATFGTDVLISGTEAISSTGACTTVTTQSGSNPPVAVGTKCTGDGLVYLRTKRYPFHGCDGSTPLIDHFKITDTSGVVLHDVPIIDGITCPAPVTAPKPYAKVTFSGGVLTVRNDFGSSVNWSTKVTDSAYTYANHTFVTDPGVTCGPAYNVNRYGKKTLTTGFSCSGTLSPYAVTVVVVS